MATVLERDEDVVTVDITPEGDETPQLSFNELLDVLDSEGLEEEDLLTIENVQERFTGFAMRITAGRQSQQWPDTLKQAAIDAVTGGGDAKSVSMSDKLFDKHIPCVKKMNAALSEANRIKGDRHFTIPHPATGMRRVRVGRLDQLQDRLVECEAAIRTAAEAMNASRDVLKATMLEHLADRYQERVYDVDFTLMYRIEYTFPSLQVPPALRQFQDLYAREVKRIQKEAAETVLLQKQMMAEAAFDAIDKLVERLESRRRLDRKHEVISIEEIDGKCLVTYRDAAVKEGSKPQVQATLTKEEVAARISDDNRRKGFQDTTAAKLFDELAYFDDQVQAIGLGHGQMKEVFDRLRSIVSGFDRETLPSTLKKSAATRDAMRNKLGTLGDAILQMSVVKSRRDIIRGDAKSQKFNPAKT